MTKQKSGKKRGTWTIDPPDDLRKIMEGALQATGTDRTDLIIRCLRGDLTRVVQAIAAERKQAARDFLKSVDADKKKPDTGVPDHS